MIFFLFAELKSTTCKEIGRTFNKMSNKPRYKEGGIFASCQMLLYMGHWSNWVRVQQDLFPFFHNNESWSLI